MMERASDLRDCLTQPVPYLRIYTKVAEDRTHKAKLSMWVHHDDPPAKHYCSSSRTGSDVASFSQRPPLR